MVELELGFRIKAQEPIIGIYAKKIMKSDWFSEEKNIIAKY